MNSETKLRDWKDTPSGKLAPLVMAGLLIIPTFNNASDAIAQGTHSSPQVAQLDAKAVEAGAEFVQSRSYSNIPDNIAIVTVMNRNDKNNMPIYRAHIKDVVDTARNQRLNPKIFSFVHQDPAMPSYTYLVVKGRIYESKLYLMEEARDMNQAIRRLTNGRDIAASPFTREAVQTGTPLSAFN